MHLIMLSSYVDLTLSYVSHYLSLLAHFLVFLSVLLIISGIFGFRIGVRLSSFAFFATTTTLITSYCFDTPTTTSSFHQHATTPHP